jgi:hypothetical protein
MFDLFKKRNKLKFSIHSFHINYFYLFVTRSKRLNELVYSNSSTDFKEYSNYSEKKRDSFLGLNHFSL